MAKLTFSAEEEEKLIEVIQKNSVIYDLAHPKYKNTIYKDEIWIDIANTIGKSVEDFKKKWKYIRDTHNRCKRKLCIGSASSAKKHWPLADRVSFLNSVENERSSESNMGSHSEEGTIDTLNIGRDSVISPVQDEELSGPSFTEEQVDHPLQDRNSPERLFKKKQARFKTSKLPMLLSKKAEERNKTIKKIEVQNQLLLDAENKRNEDDEIDLFFKSVALSVKKLPRIAIKEAKFRALNMVNELEDKYGDHSHQTIPAFYPIQPNYNLEFSNSGTPSPAISYSMTDTQSTPSLVSYNIMPHTQVTPSASPDLFQTSIANTSSLSLAPFDN